MSKQFKILIIVVVVLVIAVGLAALGLVLDKNVALPYRDWWTGNEDPAMGDWDGRLIYNTVDGASLFRNAVRYYEGANSYRHFAQCTADDCWSASRKVCSPQVTHGRADFRINIGRLPDPDYSGSNTYPVFAVGDVTADTEPAEPAMDMGLYGVQGRR